MRACGAGGEEECSFRCSAGEDATCRVWRFVDVHVLRKEEEEVQSKRKKVSSSCLGALSDHVLWHAAGGREGRRRKGAVPQEEVQLSWRMNELINLAGSLELCLSSRRLVSWTLPALSILSTLLRACWKWEGQETA